MERLGNAGYEVYFRYFSYMFASAERRIRLPPIPLGNHPGQLHHDAHQVKGLVNLDGPWEDGLLITMGRSFTVMLLYACAPGNTRSVNICAW